MELFINISQCFTVQQCAQGCGEAVGASGLWEGSLSHPCFTVLRVQEQDLP